MSKKSRFKGSFAKQHGKGAQSSLKFAWQHLCHIYWSLWMQVTCKKYLLVTCKISRLFPNTLSADGEFSLFKRDNFNATNLDASVSKTKNFSWFFAAFLKSSLHFEHFRKKGGLSYQRYFGNYGPRKTWLHQCLKCLVWRDLSESNMVNGPKHCWNVKDSSFTIFIDHC